MKMVFSSEWLKLRSIASTYHALGSAALMVVLGMVWTIYVSSLAEERGSLRAAAPEEGFLPLVQISLAIIGVLAITSEYATGMIRASLTAVPGRGTLLVGKAAVVGVVTFAAAHAILLVTYVSTRLIAVDRQLGFNDTGFFDDLPMLFASGVSVTVLALVGLGLGAATRSTAAAIVSVVVMLFVLPGIATYLPEPWNSRVASLMLPNLVPQIAGDGLSSRLGDGLLSPAMAFTALISYALVALTVGLYFLKRRDV